MVVQAIFLMTIAILVVFHISEIFFKNKKWCLLNVWKCEVKVSVISELNNFKKLPGPAKKFLIGNLDLLGGYETPFQAFGVLKKTYGDVYALQMGDTPAVVVNGYENIKEVLLTKADKFDARPKFDRFAVFFEGDNENSLAFCNWSETQKRRREILTPHTFPSKFSFNCNRFNDISLSHLHNLNVTLISTEVENPEKPVKIKPLIADVCMRVFLEYFASRTFSDSDKRVGMAAKAMDETFWEVNQGRACDFLPFLKPFNVIRSMYMKTISNRMNHFIEERVIGDRYAEWKAEDEVKDFVDAMIDSVKVQKVLEQNKLLPTIGDIIVGHTAVANFVVKTLAFLVNNPEAQRKIQVEVDAVLAEKITENYVNLNGRGEMVYTEAAILESIRLISSPIVPHVASADSSIAGYEVKKGTLVFLNNYELNTSSQFWDEPEKFIPERFIDSSTRRIKKPEHFIPFGFGKRSCMGYKIVQMLSFLLIANILRDFNILPCDKKEIKVSQCTLAVKDETHVFKFNTRA